MQYKELSKEKLDSLCADLGIITLAGREAAAVFLENAQLLDRKQRDYGPKNISGFGVFGVVVRMNDKFERIKNLFMKKKRKPVNEAIRDSFRDICNYAVIALLLDQNKWPNE